MVNEQIVTELEQSVEHALQQFESQVAQQTMFIGEQELLLIKAIRLRLHSNPSSQSATQSVSIKTPEMQVKELDALKHNSQLSKENMEELLEACVDTREVSEETWRDVTQESSKGTVGRFAWLQLSHPFKLSNEVWIVLLEALKRPEPLYCAAATQVFKASKDIPEMLRRQAMQIIVDVLQDKTLSHRQLYTPDFDFLNLDDELFETLQKLAEQDEKEI